MKARLDSTKLPVGLLAASAFMIPLLGGFRYEDVTQVPTGFFGILSEIVWGSNAPTATFCLILAPALVALLLGVLRSKVIQTPHLRVWGPLCGFLALMGLSVIPSLSRFYSVQCTLQFLAYGLVFLAAVVVSGRKKGPLVVLGAFGAGSAVVALIGIREWANSFHSDPSWRIFAGWINPNALAGALILGIFSLIALLGADTSEKPARVRQLSSAGIAICLFALYLTQSRGGLIAAILGLAVFACFTFLKDRVSFKLAVFPLLASVVVAVLCIGMATTATSHAKTSLGSRLMGGGEAAAQSKEFRILLWKGAVDSIQQSPEGVGAGMFSLASTRGGFTTQTELAHSNLVQTAAEASPIAALTLVLALIGWLSFILLSKKSLPGAIGGLGAVLAGVIALGIDGLFESNLYVSGEGAGLFLFLGLGLVMATDGVSPELSRTPVRLPITLVTVATFLGLVYFSAVEIEKGVCRTYIAASDYNSASQSALDVAGLAPWDGESEYLKGLVAPDLQSRTSDWKVAYDLLPSSKYARAYAEALEAGNSESKAETVLEEGLVNDPNNLLTLSRLMKYQGAAGKLAAQQQTAQRMVDIESKPYFKVRALAQIVPLDTLEAHLVLASVAKSNPDIIASLASVPDLMQQYLSITVSSVEDSAAKYGTTAALTGDLAIPHVLANLAQGEKALQVLSQAYRADGNSVRAEVVDKLVADCLTAGNRLSSLK